MCFRSLICTVVGFVCGLLALAGSARAQPGAAAPSQTTPPAESPPPAYVAPEEAYPAPTYGQPPGTPWAAPADSSPARREPDGSVAGAVPGKAAGEKRRYDLGVNLATSIHSETNSTSVVNAPLLEGAYAVRPAFTLGLAVGFGWMVDNEGLGQSTVRPGNPMLSGRYRQSIGPWSYSVRLGVTVPFAHVPRSVDGRLYESLYNHVLASWGLWDQWLWLADRVALPLDGRIDHRFAGGQVLSFLAAIAPLFGIRNEDGTDVVAEIAAEAELPVTARFALRPRLQTVLLPARSFDRLQTAAALRGTAATSAGRYFAEVLVSIDEPLGALTGGERWGFHLGRELGL